MPSLNFKDQFADLVERGIKKHTIRRRRKQPIKQGDNLYLFTGMRTRDCRRLRSTRCDRETYIHIGSDKTVLLGNRFLDDGEKHELAVNDGFSDFKEFLQFFRETGGLPVEGQLIEWL
jgi:hypothetical protein